MKRSLSISHPCYLNYDSASTAGPFRAADDILKFENSSIDSISAVGRKVARDEQSVSNVKVVQIVN